MEPELLHVYLMHPLGAGPDRNDNIEKAGVFASELARQLPIIPVCGWVLLARYWPETPEMRGRGLAIDRGQIQRCDEAWQLGPRVSPGMQAETGWAKDFGKDVYSLTNLSVDEIVEWFFNRRGRSGA